jgi:hypothetical protein
MSDSAFQTTPTTADTNGRPDALSEAVLPVLLHELANVTQNLTGLHSILSMEGGAALFAQRQGDLIRSGQIAEDLGWAMAVLGSACGENLLLARREPRGLSILFSLVQKACRREGLEVQPCPPDLPRLAPDCLDGWQLPWTLASLLLQSTRDGGGDWSLTHHGARWIFSWRAHPSAGSSAAPLVETLPGAEFTPAGEGRIRLALPGDWLR